MPPPQVTANRHTSSEGIPQRRLRPLARAALQHDLLAHRVGKSGGIKGREREQHCAVYALGCVFRGLAHIDEDNLAPRHGIVNLLRGFCRYGG